MDSFSWSRRHAPAESRELVLQRHSLSYICHPALCVWLHARGAPSSRINAQLDRLVQFYKPLFYGQKPKTRSEPGALRWV